MHIDFHSFIKSIIKAVEAKDNYTAGHSDRVAGLTERIAREIGLPTSEVEMIHIASHLHDIGKIGIPDGVLMKSGRLNEEEYALIQRHAIIGWEILSEIENFKEIARNVRSHHERPDGKGYPDGLKLGEIPTGALLIAVADAYDAMTTVRVYRNPVSSRRALEEINLLGGKQFAEFAVEGLISVMKDYE